MDPTTRNHPKRDETIVLPSASSAHAHARPIPIFYRVVFLWLEPASILAGAFYACFQQSMYLRLTHEASAPRDPVPPGTSIVLMQLANLYFALALLEASILRATSDITVWKTALVGLLVADVGHVLSVARHASLYQYWVWNAIDWGNIPFVYFLALTRLCLLLNVGYGTEQTKTKGN